MEGYTQYATGPGPTVGGLLAYLIFAISLYKIGSNLGAPYAWLAFIPIANLVLLFQLADMSPWFVLLIVVPCVGWLILWILYMVAWSKVAVKCDKPSFWGILAGLPILNLIAPPVIAFT